MIKRILVLVFLKLIIVIDIDCQSIDKESNLSKLKLDIINKGRYGVENTYFSSIDLRITNLSSDTVKFWIYTCGYLSNILIKSSYYEIVPSTCDSNYPELISLKNNQSIYLPIIIQPRSNKSKTIEETKFGFVVVFKDQYNYECKADLTDLSLNLRRKEKQMIWSENTISNSYNMPFYIDK